MHRPGLRVCVVALKSVWLWRCSMLDSYLLFSLVKEEDSCLSNLQDSWVLSPHPSHSAIQTLAAIPKLNHVANGCIQTHTPLILLSLLSALSKGKQLRSPDLSCHPSICSSDFVTTPIHTLHHLHPHLQNYLLMSVSVSVRLELCFQ